MTGLRRTSLYNAFGDKRQLFRLALQRYLETVLSGFLDVLAQARTASGAVQAVLAQVIALHFDEAHPGGCMVVLSLLESHHHDPDTRKTLEQSVRQLRDAIVARLQRAAAEGELPPGSDCRLLANQVMATLTGMIVMAKADITRKELEAVAENAAAALLPAGGDRPGPPGGLLR